MKDWIVEVKHPIHGEGSVRIGSAFSRGQIPDVVKEHVGPDAVIVSISSAPDPTMIWNPEIGTP